MNLQEALQALYDSISESIERTELLHTIIDNHEFKLSMVGAIGAAKGIQDSIKNLAALNGFYIE